MNIENVLVLVAHSDDESLGAGGIIPQLVKCGSRVSVVIASNGILTVRGTEQINRNDTQKACAILGVEDIHFLDFDDQKFDQYPIADIANAVSNLNFSPDLIISHASTDLNLDHQIIADVAKIIGRPKGKPISILGCEIPNTSAWNAQPFHANYYVDIQETLELKIKAFSQYENELQEFPHPWSERGLTVLSQFRGMEAGTHHAEAFQVVRMFH